MAKKYSLAKRKPSSSLLAYNELLNEEQFQAVKYNKGPQIIAAGAGTGKTRTLTYKVSWLIEHGTPASKIVLLTFTRRAAQEMKQRATKILDDRCMAIQGGTFHSFANVLLRKYGNYIHLPQNFSILDSSETADVINLLRTQKKLHQRDRRFPRKEVIQKVYSKSVNTGKSIKNIIEKDYPQFIDECLILQSLWNEFQEFKKSKSLLDYDDLLLYLRELLENTEARKLIQSTVDYLIIDEYQDTNPLQAEIAKYLCPKNIMVVGDDLQSIYSFRGADHTNILDFQKEFSKSKLFLLQENYRSQMGILNFCNELMSQAEDKYEKKLFSKIGASEKPARIALADLEQQADFVCQRIMDLREEGVPLSEIAVLFRNAYHSNELEVALTQGNIPFKKYGGIRFAEAAHIKDVLAFLKVWHNPLDLISLQRILLLLEGVGPGTAQRLIQQEHTLGEWDLSQYSKKKFNIALKELQELYSFLKRNDTSLLMGMEKILAFYTPYLNQIFDDANRRIKDIESLESMAKNQNSLESFLSEMSLDPPSTLDEDEFDEDEFLTLSTIHSAKGLEFHSVFFLSTVEGAIPSPWSKDEKDLEEELRLFYVACTRAKISLYLCVPDDFHQSALKAAGLFFAEPSRFVQTKNILNVVEDWEIE